MLGWDKFNSFIYTMLKIAYINLLWIFFSILGLVVFGLFPATAAMFAVAHKIIQGGEDIKILPTFWEYYKTDFLKLNAYGLIFLAVGYFLYYDFTFLQINKGQLTFLYGPLIFILITLVITLLFFFPVFVHFKLRFFQYFKQSFLIAITVPADTFLIGLSAVAIYIAVTILPGIILLFTGSVFAYLSIYISFRAFDKIEKRQAKV